MFIVLLISVPCSHFVMISSCQKCKTLAWLLFLQHASHHITTEEWSAEHLLASAHQNSLKLQYKFWQRLTSTCSAEHSSLGCAKHASPYCTNLFFWFKSKWYNISYENIFDVIVIFSSAVKLWNFSLKIMKN